MLQGLRDLPGANSILPFVRLFYGRSSTFVWTDDRQVPHRITQAEGGEQGDPLMPALFALGAAPALAALQRELRAGERVRAFLDDVYVTSQPDRVAPLYARLEHHLFAHARIRLNAAKTRVWNAGGVAPAGLPSPPEPARVWVGDPDLPPDERGLRVLRNPPRFGRVRCCAPPLSVCSALCPPREAPGPARPPSLVAAAAALLRVPALSLLAPGAPAACHRRLRRAQR